MPRSQIRLFFRSKLVFGWLKSTYTNFSSDKGMRMAASIAYYTIFSLAPLLVIAIAIAGMVFGERAAQNAIAALARSRVLSAPTAPKPFRR